MIAQDNALLRLANGSTWNVRRSVAVVTSPAALGYALLLDFPCPLSTAAVSGTCAQGEPFIPPRNSVLPPFLGVHVLSCPSMGRFPVIAGLRFTRLDLELACVELSICDSGVNRERRLWLYGWYRHVLTMRQSGFYPTLHSSVACYGG